MRNYGNSTGREAKRTARLQNLDAAMEIFSPKREIDMLNSLSELNSRDRAQDMLQQQMDAQGESLDKQSLLSYIQQMMAGGPETQSALKQLMEQAGLPYSPQSNQRPMDPALQAKMDKLGINASTFQ
jgi:hypothetical protein